jgi:hypothetical protein
MVFSIILYISRKARIGRSKSRPAGNAYGPRSGYDPGRERVREVHDRFRGRQGSWKRAVETVRSRPEEPVTRRLD